MISSDSFAAVVAVAVVFDDEGGVGVVGAGGATALVVAGVVASFVEEPEGAEEEIILLLLLFPLTAVIFSSGICGINNNSFVCRGRLAQGKNRRFVNLRFKGTKFDSCLRQDFFKRNNINSQFKA